MRKWNGILTAVMMILFLAHAIMGSFQLIGAGNVISRTVSYLLAAVIFVHALLGAVLTARTLKTIRASGAGYFRKNKLFWAGRVSGFAILAFLIFHLTAFSDRSAPVYRLVPFTAARLATQLLLILTIAVHVLINVRPAFITMGVRGHRRWAADILFVLSVILLFAVLAMLIYYLRWNRV